MKDVDEGIFLHRISYSNSSLITTFFTRKKGLQKFVFRGGKKKAHQLYPLSISELNYYGRPESDLLQLTAVETTGASSFQFNPIKSTIAFFIAETIQKCVIENDFDPSMFPFLAHEIFRLDVSDDCALFPIEFLVGFSEIIGIQPLIESDGQVFNLDEGTIGNRGDRLLRSSEGAHVTLIAQLIQGESPEQCSRETRENALEAMMAYYCIHVPRLKAFDSYEIVREILS